MMPRYIIRLDDGKKSYYLEWSTIVDAPVTEGMSRDEFTSYYIAAYGRQSGDLPNRLARVDAYGTSAIDRDTVDELIQCNRAGLDETRLTKAQLIDYYCKRRAKGDAPKGTRRGKR